MTNTITVAGSYGTLIVHRLGGIVLGGTHEVERQIAPGHWTASSEPGVAEEYADIRWFDPHLLPAEAEWVDILDCAFACERGCYYPQLQPVRDEARCITYRRELPALPQG